MITKTKNMIVIKDHTPESEQLTLIAKISYSTIKLLFNWDEFTFTCIKTWLLCYSGWSDSAETHWAAFDGKNGGNVGTWLRGGSEQSGQFLQNFLGSCDSYLIIKY